MIVQGEKGKIEPEENGYFCSYLTIIYALYVGWSWFYLIYELNKVLKKVSENDTNSSNVLVSAQNKTEMYTNHYNYNQH